MCIQFKICRNNIEALFREWFIEVRTDDGRQVKAIPHGELKRAPKDDSTVKIQADSGIK
jgi:hypothetical protein